MKGRLINMLILLGISLFCGLIGITVGIGSFYPPLNRVAGPIVCGGNPIEITQQKSSPQPGRTTYSIIACCVDPDTGTKVERTFLTQLVSGMIYGLAIYAFIGLSIAWSALRRKLLPAEEKQDENDNHR